MTSEQRIERLERRCRFLMASLVGIVAVCGVALFGAAQNRPGNVVRAEAVEIADADGNIRLRLGKLESLPGAEVFGLVMKDAAGGQRVCLQDHAQLMLNCGDGRVVLAASEQGAAFQLSGRASRPRAIMSVRDDQAEIQLRDTHGEVSWRQATPSITVARDAKEADPFAK